MSRTAGKSPLIAHVIHHLVMGGLENGLVNLINRIPYDRYRHAIICMAYSSDFRLRIARPDVEVITMGVHERGHHRVLPDLVRVFRRLKPDAVHSRNLSGLDALFPATLAGVPFRIHGEHGWDSVDLSGRNRKHQWLRRLHAPLVHRYIALSKHQERYLTERIGIAPRRITQIYNGVDVDRFHLAGPEGSASASRNREIPGGIVVGSVGRMQGVKDPMNLAEAFLHLRRARPDLKSGVKLAMIGEGPLREKALSRLREAGDESVAWLPGAREDIPELLQSLDIFVLPSRAEGISNTILEAMATGLPVIATRVGGNPELVEEGRTGFLVPPSDPPALAEAIARYVDDPALAKQHGMAGRERAEREFSLDRMVERYMEVYDEASRR